MRQPSLYLQKRMAQRRITEAEIDEALGNAQTTYASAQGPQPRLVVLGTTAAGRRLKVVVLQADPEFVVTVADRDDEVQ